MTADTIHGIDHGESSFTPKLFKTGCEYKKDIGSIENIYLFVLSMLIFLGGAEIRMMR